MKFHIKIIFTLIFIAFLYSCTSSDPTSPSNGNTINYFPDKEGIEYLFSVTESNLTGLIEQSSRFVFYIGDTVINGISYRIQIDSVKKVSGTEEMRTYFRKSETGVFYFIDTSGFAAALPDSLRSMMSITPEIQTLLLLLGEGSYWQVFKLTITLQPGLTYAPYRITANFVNEEPYLLQLINGSVNIVANKIKFDLEYRFNPIDPVQKYTAYTWVSKDIGIVKMEGNAIVLNAILNGEVSLEDSSKTIKQDLIDYIIP